jgi:hypothetical protein
MNRIAAIVTVCALLVACAPSQSLIATAVAQTQTAAPAPMPASTATSLPTSKPGPTNTPQPSAIPLPTDTPRPTDTVAPSDTPEPTSTPTPTQAPIVLSGKGNSVVNVDKEEDPALAHITYTGGGNFAVWNYGAGNQKLDLLVNTIGNYEGTRPLDFRSDEHTVRFEVQGSGKWKIEVLPLEEMRSVDIPGKFDGKGDDVVILIGSGMPDLLKFDASKAKSNFAVWGYGKSEDLLVNEIAPYSGTALVDSSLPTDSGRLVLVIEAEGSWAIEVTTR